MITFARRALVGLSAGLAVTAAMSTLLALPAEAKPKAATGASVIGSGSAGSGTFDINAQAQPGSSAATGYADFELGIGYVDGQVTCLQVVDGVVGISGTLGPQTTAVDTTQSPGFYLYIADDTTQNPDLLQLQFVGYVPVEGDCAPQWPVSPAAVTSGDIQVTPGTPGKIKKP